MNVVVLLQPLSGVGYRASTVQPFALAADGATREEALHNLEHALLQRAGQGAEVVTLRIPLPHRNLPSVPLWPDDEITRAWLEGITEYRRQLSPCRSS